MTVSCIERNSVRVLKLSAAFLVTFGLSACSISETVHVRNGISPQLADDNVRFRTTYYFRSVDFCEPEDVHEESNFTFDGRLAASSDQVFIRKKRIKRVLKDSLYRFTMTGKASPLSKIRFESGTLKSWQIDPFGASAAFDKQNNRFYWKSQESTQADANTAEIIDDVKQLSELRQSLAEANPAGASAIDSLIISRLTTLNNVYGPENTLHLAQAIAAGLHKISATAVTDVKDIAEAVKVESKPPTTTPSQIDPVAQKGSVIASFSLQIKEVEKEVAYLKEVNDTAKKAAEAEADTLAKEAVKLDPNILDGATVEKAVPRIAVRIDPPTEAINNLAEKQPALKPIQKTTNEAIEKFEKASAALAKAQSALDSLKRYLTQLEGMKLAGTGGAESGECAASSRFGRGFQLIGPEGVKTFNQDDRLIMAMSSSPQPILSALQELSGRMLKQEPGTSDRLLPLVQEQLRINEARQSLPAIEAQTNTGLKAAVEALAEKLNEGDQP